MQRKQKRISKRKPIVLSVREEKIKYLQKLIDYGFMELDREEFVNNSFNNIINKATRNIKDQDYWYVPILDPSYNSIFLQNYLKTQIRNDSDFYIYKRIPEFLNLKKYAFLVRMSDWNKYGLYLFEVNARHKIRALFNYLKNMIEEELENQSDDE